MSFSQYQLQLGVHGSLPVFQPIFQQAAYQVFQQPQFQLGPPFESFQQAPFQGYQQAPYQCYQQAPFQGYQQAPFQGYHQAPFQGYQQSPIRQASIRQAPVQQAPIQQAPIQQARIQTPLQRIQRLQEALFGVSQDVLEEDPVPLPMPVDYMPPLKSPEETLQALRKQQWLKRMLRR